MKDQEKREKSTFKTPKVSALEPTLMSARVPHALTVRSNLYAAAFSQVVKVPRPGS